MFGCQTLPTVPEGIKPLVKFDRPSRFPELCRLEYDPNKDKNERVCVLIGIWATTSDGAFSPPSQQQVLETTRHVLELNHIIDLYEMQVDKWNDDKHLNKKHAP